MKRQRQLKINILMLTVIAGYSK